MKRAVTLPWNAAAWRHRNPQPEYHHVAPIGTLTADDQNRQGITVIWDDGDYSSCSDDTCSACGYHVCSCERQA